MHAFLIELENKTGELARVTEAVYAHGVDITGVTGATCGSSGSLVLFTDDEAKTRTALGETGSTFREIEATETHISQAPGSLAKVARRLADGGVNIEALVPTGMAGNEVTIAFVTSDPAKAKTILSQVSSASR